MESIKNLIARFGPTGSLIVAGFILIIYVAFGFVYWQQGAKQGQLNEQIIKLGAVVARPLASSQELQTEYDKVNNSLALMTENSKAIEMLVSIANQSGIDTAEGSGKFRVLPATFSQTKVGGGTYQLMSFRDIIVQGDYEKVMAFISNLDSGKTLETMVLKKAVVSKVEFTFTGVEGDRRAEFRNVASAVLAMMTDNTLLKIPNPMSFAGGVAANFTGDNPDTVGTVEGFPDITTTAAAKGYSGNVTPRDGYVLYGHDKISTDDTTQYQTVNYLSTLTTKYYYTSEANGTVRQWSGPNVATAVEYGDSEKSKMETKIIVDIDIYFKPQ